MQFMSREAALDLMRLSEEVSSGKRKLPKEIEDKKKEIAKATRKAELFVIMLGVVDEGMVMQVVRLKIDLDRLYAQFAEGTIN